MTIIDEIAAERERQITEEGWTPEHDDSEHWDGQLALAAGGYAIHAGGRHDLIKVARWDGEKKSYVPRSWPWDAKWWKPGNPRRDLIKAAALLVAEIERIDRAAVHDQKETG